jgi:HEAT repeat protein
MTTIRPLIAAAFACLSALPAAAQIPFPPRAPLPPRVSVVAPPEPPPAPEPPEPAPPAPQPPPPPPPPSVAIWPDVAFDLDLDALDFAELERVTTDINIAVQDLLAQGPLKGAPAPPNPFNYVKIGGSPEALYDQARGFIDRNQYDRALDVLDRLVSDGGARADAAMYWKAYSLSKIARRSDALVTIAEMQKRFANSPWIRDARFLEAELRQASGQSVTSDDEELKLLALSGLMRSDSETALPMIEKLLAGNDNLRVKDRALFVASQSRTPKGRELITNVAKGSTNPDLKMSAIQYLGRMSGPESLQALDEVYRGTTDQSVKRTILRSFMVARAKDRLLSVAKSETNGELRGEAVQQLGAMRAGAELEELYRSESNVEVKKRILQALFVANATDRLGPIARNEKDPELRRAAIHQLGISNRTDAAETLVGIYNADASVETRKAVIDALGMHRNATALVNLARAEKNTELKTEMVRRLSTMRSQEARDYMLELLK